MAGREQMAGHRVGAALVVVVDGRRRDVALQRWPAHQHQVRAGRVQGTGEAGHAQLVLVVVVGAAEQDHGGDSLLAHEVDQREFPLGVVAGRADQGEPAAQGGGALDALGDMGESGAGDVVDEDRHRGGAAPGERTGMGVGDVVQVPDDLHHPAAQFLRHRVVAGQHPRDAGHGDARALRHITDGRPAGVTGAPCADSPLRLLHGSGPVARPGPEPETVSHGCCGPAGPGLGGRSRCRCCRLRTPGAGGAGWCGPTGGASPGPCARSEREPAR